MVQPAVLAGTATRRPYARRMSLLNITDVDRIRIIAINRPERRNAIDRPTADALQAAFTSFDDDDAVDVAVLTGEGNTFCAGADLKAPAEGNASRFEPTGAAPLGPTRMMLSKPVVAAIEGYAVAGGLEFAIWCDLRVAAADATIGVACRRWGLPLADGGTVRLPRLVGQGRALDLILTGRNVDGAEAQAIGLVERVVPSGEALPAAIDLARQIADHPQWCLRNDRLSTYEQWPLPLDDALANEFAHARASLARGNPADGVARFTGSRSS